MDNICKDIPSPSRFKFATRVKNPLIECVDIKPSSSTTELLLDDVPESVNEMGVKGMNHFFRAKIKKMQNDYERLQTEYKMKSDELRKVQRETQKVEEEKEKWFQIATGHKTQITKLESQVCSMSSKLQSKDGENTLLRKENEQLQKDLKNELFNVSTAEKKLKKITEEYEKQRATLKNAKQEEKDLRESHRKQINEMSNIIKKIEKHKMELLNGFKKQMLLIDNLKKQKAHIECFKLTEKADADFMKILDWKTGL
ncbi:hypothetical protein QE152_g9479 [Popillia japonica]|uniref:Testis expressed 9 n=1 Tax=Popillia japonica TaxID=7064 RepID=A0AAW1LY41_POPJA